MSWLDDHPEVTSVRPVAADLNGQARGKRIPRRFADQLLIDGTRFPYSILNLDIWGEDIEGSPMVFQSGDPDAVLKPTERGFLPVPWLPTPSALLPVWMFHEDGTPFDGDPRHALARLVDRYTALGLTPVVATELEFFIIDDQGSEPRVPPCPLTGKRHHQGATLSLRDLDAWDEFFTQLYEACEAMDIPADTATSEGSPGQFEVNLMHQPDALKAADDAWLFKLLVQNLARDHGAAGSFMAKPYADYAGSGLHVHFSVLDSDGVNIFDERNEGGADLLGHAIAGCLKAMQGSTLIFAPHGSSYDRFVPGAHAPTAVSWAYENRTTAIRVPVGAPVARRIEHRVAGGDINPYLLIAAILGAALNGLEDHEPPPPPITGNAYDLDLPYLPNTWEAAIEAFDTSPEIKQIFTPTLIENLLATKRQESRRVAKLTEDERRDLYLDRV